MYTLLFIFSLLGISLAGKSHDSTHLETQHVTRHGGATALQLINEVKEAASNLQELVEKADSPHVKRLAEFYKKNQHYLNLCQETLGENVSKASSCIAITGDIANITALMIYGWQLLADIGVDCEYILNELNTCASDSAWKKFTCFENAFKDIQNVIKKYSTDCNEFLQDATTLLKDIEDDIANCFAFSESASSKLFEIKVQLCKLKLL